MSILEIINKLAADNGRLAKEAILKQEVDNAQLQQAFKLALDPRTNFYIKKIPAYIPRKDAGINDLSWAFDELGVLSRREATGNAAIEYLTQILQQLNEDDATIIERIIDRDLRCGVNESTVNKVWKKLIPEYPYQRCELPKAVKLSTWPWKDGVISQIKADGSFANVIRFPDSVTIMTRNGTVYPEDTLTNVRYDVFACYPEGVITHGELVIYKNGEVLPREISNGKLNSIAKGGRAALEKDEIVRFLAWDIMSYDDFLNGVCKTPYAERLANLRSVIKFTVSLDIIKTRIVKSFEEAMAHYCEIIEAGNEGTIIKHPAGIWKDGTSKEQVKLKIDCDIEVRMKSLNAGKGKNAATFGSVRCVSEDEAFEVNVSGFKDNARMDLFQNWDSYCDGIITIRINNIMKPTRNNPKYSAFLPRFIEHRPDKATADTLDRIQEQFDNIVKGKV